MDIAGDLFLWMICWTALATVRGMPSARSRGMPSARSRGMPSRSQSAQCAQSQHGRGTDENEKLAAWPRNYYQKRARSRTPPAAEAPELLVPWPKNYYQKSKDMPNFVARTNLRMKMAVEEEWAAEDAEDLADAKAHAKAQANLFADHVVPPPPPPTPPPPGHSEKRILYKAMPYTPPPPGHFVKFLAPAAGDLGPQHSASVRSGGPGDLPNSFRRLRRSFHREPEASQPGGDEGGEGEETKEAKEAKEANAELTNAAAERHEARMAVLARATSPMRRRLCLAPKEAPKEAPDEATEETKQAKVLRDKNLRERMRSIMASKMESGPQSSTSSKCSTVRTVFRTMVFEAYTEDACHASTSSSHLSK